MKDRCDNPNAHKFKNYGARGIGYDPAWKRFANFLSDMGPRPAGTTLDRIDNEGDYRKANCRWATAKEQGRNRRGVRWIEIGPFTLTLAEWSTVFGISPFTASCRITKQGWSPHDAVSTPLVSKTSRRASSVALAA